jgi:hypothetical protein
MIPETLKNVRTKKGMSQRELAEMLGVSQQTIGSWEVGRTSPDPTTIKRIADFFNVSTDYLLGNTTVPLPDALPLPDDTKKIPIIGTVKCGVGGIAYEDHEGELGFDARGSSEYFALRCRGASMIGIGIQPNDLAIVRVQPDVNSGELAIVIIDGEEGTLKRVRKQEDAIVLEAANPDYPARSFAGKEMRRVQIIGKVVEVRRKY